MITDSQVHIFDRTRPEMVFRRPPGPTTKWPNGLPYEDLIKEMDAAGVDRVTIVPPDGMVSNALPYALEAADKYPKRFALMVSFDPTTEDARTRLQELAKTEHVLGIRLGIRPNPTWLDDGTLDWVWPACSDLGMPITLWISMMAGRLKPIAEKYPNLTLSIDHMGRVPDALGGEAFGQGAMEGLMAVAPYPNVYIKVSSVPDSSAQPYPFHDLDPYLRQIYDAYGSHRMLWGSDLSGLSCSYGECVDHFRKALDFLTAEDREWILGKALAVAYKWPEA